MLRFFFVLAAIVFAVCAAAQWGVGDLNQIQEIAVSLAAYFTSTIVEGAVVYTSQHARTVTES